MRRLHSVIIIILMLCISTEPAYSFQDYEKRVRKIYKDIVKSIGNRGTLAPKLEIINKKEKNVAYIRKNTIYFEINNANLLSKFGEDTDNAIAYILGHELAHHYLDHSWMRQVGTTFFSQEMKEFVKEERSSEELRKKEEMEADLHAGFYATLAGYNSLSVAKDALQLIYDTYQVNPNMKGYPSLDDRKGIIDLKLKELKKISSIFKIANLCMVIEEHEASQNLYEDIIQRNFPSREIWNNLGITHFFQALDMTDYDVRKYIFPVVAEQNTRAEMNSIREVNAFGEGSDPEEKMEAIIENFSRAREYFDNAYNNDKTFLKARMNYFTTELLLNFLDPEEFYFDISRVQNNSKISEVMKKELSGIYYALKKDRKQAKKLFKEASQLGSSTSRMNFEFMQKEEEDLGINDLLSSIGDEGFTDLFSEKKFITIDSVDLTSVQDRGLKQPYEFISTTNVKIRIKKMDNSTIYGLNNEKILIQESKDADMLHQYATVDKLTELMGLPDKVMRFNTLKYYVYDEMNSIFIFDGENKIKNIISYLTK